MGGLQKLSGDRSAEDLAVGMTRSLVAWCSEPEWQAYLLGCVLTAGIAPRHIRPLPGIILTICGGIAARQAYLAARDIRSIARAAGHAHPAQP